MTRRTTAIIITTGVAAAAAITVGIAGSAGAFSSDGDQPITGDALVKASEAALAHTGGGTVTETEVGDEDSLYEVEVRLPDGRSVDVQLDENFEVVDTMSDDDAVDDAD